MTDPVTDRGMPRWVPRAIAIAAGWVVLLYAGWWMLRELRSLLVMVAVALFLSLAMEPAVDRLAHRGWRRGAATGLVLGVTVVVLFVFLAAAGSIVVGQTQDIVDDAPRYVREVERFANDTLGINWNADSLVRRLRREGTPLPSQDTIVSSAFTAAYLLGRGVLQFVTVIIFAFYMTADGPKMRRAICSRVPRRHQQKVLDTWEIAIDKTGGYLFSRGIQAAISAVVTSAVLFALGVPYALALGLWVGVVSQFIPTIGTYIAMVLPLVIAFADRPSSALWVLIFLVLYQQFENYILGPRVTKRSMDVHPAVAIGTVFAGGLLLGGVGAVLALPATAIVQAVITASTEKQSVVHAPLTTDPEPHTGWRQRVRDRRARNRGDSP